MTSVIANTSLHRGDHSGIKHLQELINTSDVSIFPVLCGFETPITGQRSPWCDVLTEQETLNFAYAQDLRYWYGSGLGTTVDKKLMLPFLTAVVQRFVDGPNATYTNGYGSTPFQPPALIATFTNDGQINQLAAAIGVFDDQEQLPPRLQSGT